MSAPPVPRRVPIAEKKGMVSRDWDASYFQPLTQQVKLGTSGGTYANNAAAVTAGLQVGQVYQTVTGELRIVV